MWHITIQQSTITTEHTSCRLMHCFSEAAPNNLQPLILTYTCPSPSCIIFIAAPRNQTFWESLSPRKKVGIAAGATGAVLALITLVVLLTVLSNGQSTGVRDGDDGRQINPSDSKIGRVRYQRFSCIIDHLPMSSLPTPFHCRWRPDESGQRAASGVPGRVGGSAGQRWIGELEIACESRHNCTYGHWSLYKPSRLSNWLLHSLDGWWGSSESPDGRKFIHKF